MKINFGKIHGQRLIEFKSLCCPFRYQDFLYKKAAWKAWQTRRRRDPQLELPLFMMRGKR